MNHITARYSVVLSCFIWN